MEAVGNWKAILLQWIKQCNFLEKPFFSIDQTEIDIFFIHFKDRFKDRIQQKKISEFLKNEYPLYEQNFDDEDLLSSSDHFYVYSLLLHYSCVRCPNEFFQEHCTKLNDFAQKNIKMFFQKLLEEKSITKETLRHVIASLHMFTPPINRLMYSADSPMKTPRKVTDISPPTPRSCMLQEKNKKVHSLKAQLETVTYEKSTLEMDLKNYQDKIAKLNQELKRSHQEIDNLRNDIYSRNTDSGEFETKHTEGEQINRRLAKQIAQKEIEIAKQRDIIDSLTEQKDALSEKLKKAEKQMKVLHNKIEEFAEQVDDLQHDLEQKNCTIQSLSDEKTELEHILSERRSSTVNSRPDLNMSAEFLDLSRATNSSGSIHSPENLGSVVDIKLREKENENEILREEISSIRTDNTKLSKAITKLTVTYSELFDTCNENLTIDNESTDPANSFLILSNNIQSFANKYKENCFILNKTKENAKQIEEQNQSLINKFDKIQNDNVNLKKEIVELSAANKSLTASKTILENSLIELENKLENSLKERSEEANNLKNLQKELESLKIEKNDSERLLEQERDHLKKNLHELQMDNDTKEKRLQNLEVRVTESMKHNSELLQQMNVEKLKNQSEIESLNCKLNNSLTVFNENKEKIQELENEKQDFEKKILNLCTKEQSILEKFELEKSQNFQLEKKTANLSTELEKLKKIHEAVLTRQNYLLQLTEANKGEIYSLNKKIHELTDDQRFKAKTISKLKIDKKHMIDSMQAKICNLTTAIDRYEMSFEEKTKELYELTQKCHSTEDKLNSLKNKFEEVSSELSETKEVLSKRTVHIFNVVTDLKSRLGVIMTKHNLKRSLETSYVYGDELFENKLTDKVQHLYDDIASIESACDLLLENTVSLQQKLLVSENTTDNLNEENCLLSQNISDLKAEREKQDSIAQTLIKTEEGLRTEITSMTSLVKKLETDIETSQKMLSNKTQDAVMLLEKHKHDELKITELQSKIVALENDLKLENENVKERTQELESVKLQLEAEISEKLIVRKDFEKTTERLSELHSKICTLESESASLKEEARKTADDIVRDFESTKLQLENEVTEKQQIKKELEHSKLQLKSEITNKQKIIEDLAILKLKFESEVKERKQTKEILENIKLEKQQIREDLEKTQLQLEAEYSAKKQIEKDIANIKLQLEVQVTKSNVLVEDLENTKNQLDIEVRNTLQLKEELERTRLLLQNEVRETNNIKEDLEKVRLQLESDLIEKWRIKEEFDSTKLQLESEVTESRIELKTSLKENQHIKEELETTKVQLNNEVSKKCKLEDDLNNSNKKVHELQTKITDLESEFVKINKAAIEQNQIIENTEVQLTNESLEKEQLKDSLKKVQNELIKLQTSILQLETNNKLANKKIDELENSKLQLEKEALEKDQFIEALENKYRDEAESYKHNLLLVESEVNRLKAEETRLLAETQVLKSSSENQIQKCNKEIDEQKQNISRLIQEITTIRKEREVTEEEKTNLLKRFENEKESLEANKRSIEEKLQSAEKEVLAKLNLLNVEQLKCQDLNNQLKKLQLDNVKLKDTADANMKRIEKQALMLGESQAKCQRFRKEADTAQNSLEKLKSSTEVTQRESNRLKENLLKCEKLNEQLELRLQSNEKEIEQLREEKKNLEISENDLKTSTSSLEKIKLNLEDKIRKLAKSLSDSNVALSRVEQDKVQLNLEVGGLNKQLEENKTRLNMKLKEIETLTSNLIDAKNTNSQLIELNEKQQSEADEIHEANTNLNDQLSKLSLRLQISQEEHQSAKSQMESLRSEMEDLKLKRDAIEKDHQAAVKRLIGVEEVVEERQTKEADFISKIKSLEMQVSKLSKNCLDLEELQKNDKIIVEKLRSDIKIFEAKLQKRRAICEEKEKKWNEEKEILLAEAKESSEERVKETRLELEGKLEKMKNKMDTPTLDDSLSTLLNTGQRKKVSGATSYKRPGPPTPSKNAGRLSFGGIGELNRELLKEDMSSVSSTSKTPAKFRLFSSKLSMRDERKSYVTNFKRKQHIYGTVQCSSTPRKSKAHIDQRCLLDQIMSTASPGADYSPDCIAKTAVNLPSSLKKLELSRRKSLQKWRQPKLSYATDSANSDANSPQMREIKYSSSGAKQRLKRFKDRRSSIYLRGSMFARNCRTPTMGVREVFKRKSKIQRNANFNQYRSEILNECLVKKSSFCPECDEPCNNNNDDFFLEEIDMNNHAIDDCNSYEDDFNDDKTSMHFQQLLAVKSSNAPFDISEMNTCPSYSNVNNSSSNVHSRTIYGASVILNRKIPNVNTTMVRKSSIYVKGNDGKSVILVTNQTITLRDLAHMWLQMNVSAKTFIALSFTATLVGILSFVIQFIYQ